MSSNSGTRHKAVSVTKRSVKQNGTGTCYETVQLQDAYGIVQELLDSKKLFYFLSLGLNVKYGKSMYVQHLGLNKADYADSQTGVMFSKLAYSEPRSILALVTEAKLLCSVEFCNGKAFLIFFEAIFLYFMTFLS